MNMIKIEIKKIINRKQFWILLCLLLISVFIDFYYTCKACSGKPLSQVASAYELMILYNLSGSSAGMFFNSFLFFLISSAIASDLFYNEIEMGIHNAAFTRISRRRYIVCKAAAMMLIVFSTVMGCLLISQILALSAFPLQGNLTSKITYNELLEPDENRIFSYFQNYYPYVNSLIWIAVRGVIASVTSLLAFSLTFLYRTKQYLILLTPMLIYILYSTAAGLIASGIEDIWLSTIVETNLLAVNGYGSIWVSVLFLAFEVLVSLLLIRKGIHDDEVFL